MDDALEKGDRIIAFPLWGAEPKFTVAVSCGSAIEVASWASLQSYGGAVHPA
jgi:hypothetical protein